MEYLVNIVHTFYMKFKNLVSLQVQYMIETKEYLDLRLFSLHFL